MELLSNCGATGSVLLQPDFVEIVPVLDFGVKCCPYDCFSSGNNVRPVWVCKEDLE